VPASLWSLIITTVIGGGMGSLVGQMWQQQIGRFDSLPPVVDRAAICGGAMPCPSLPTNNPTVLLGRLPCSQLELPIRSSALQAIVPHMVHLLSF
jgi:hypothetical protein